MSIRVIEVLFRHKVAVVLPLVLFSALGLLWALSTPSSTYRAHATIWVSSPSDFNQFSATDYNAYISPAQNQASAMRELMATRSFLRSVAAEISAEPPTDALLNKIRLNTSIVPLGDHVLAIDFSGSDPVAVVPMLSTLLDRFQVHYSELLYAKAEEASAFYQEQLTLAQATYDEATSKLRAYIVLRPYLANVDISSPSTISTTDLEFASLLQAQQTAKETYNRVFDDYAASEIAQRSAGAKASAFTIVDEPEPPEAPVPLTKSQLLMQPAIGFALGTVISAAIFLLCWRLDDRVRVPSDFAFLGNGVEIISLPELKARRRYRWPQSFVRVAAFLHSGLTTSRGKA